MYRAEADQAVVAGASARLVDLASGPVTLLLILAYFTAELQGYYFTFLSLQMLQLFVELGLARVIISFASHEWSKLGLDERGRIVGEANALSRLVSLGRVTFRWYAVGAGIFTVGVGVGGYVFFSQSPYPGIHWVGPWLAFCLFTGIRLCLVPPAAVLEGCNQVSQVYSFRFMRMIPTTLCTWLAIVLGAELWAVAAATATGVAMDLWFLGWRYGRFFRPFFSPPSGPRVSWRWEIWPMQWRMALSGMSGYLVYGLFTPILFHYHGPVVAGQMGMTWRLARTLSTVAATWIYVRAPRFGMFIAKREFVALDRLALRTAVASFVVACVGAGVIMALTLSLHLLNHPLDTRFLPPLPTGLFLIATILMQISYAQSLYLRAHKKEPLVTLSVATGILVGLFTWFLGSRFGATGIAASYLAVIAVLVIPWGTLIWYRCRAAWHAATPGPADAPQPVDAGEQPVLRYLE